jgi:nucleotide-binding universal stress UspA family protein
MTSGQIVVGVDGSAESMTALRWAIRHATRNHATVTAVEVSHRPRLAPGTSYAIQPYGMAPPIERIRHSTRLHAAVVAARGSMRDAPPVTELHVEGEPGVELTHIAESAAMLVLGHSPRSRLADLILGGTATECLRTARCPVVLVPAHTIVE